MKNIDDCYFNKNIFLYIYYKWSIFKNHGFSNKQKNQLILNYIKIFNVKDN